LLAQATDRRVAHVIGSRDVREHLSRLSASNGFPALMAGQLWLSTKDYPPCQALREDVRTVRARLIDLGLDIASLEGDHPAQLA